MLVPAVLLALAPLSPGLHAVAPDDGLGGPDVKPHWIWADGPAGAGQTVRLRKEFSPGKRPASATLTVAADNEATVWIDGTKVLENKSWAEPSRADVTALAGGRNKVLSVQAKNADGPAGVLVMLEMKYADGSSKRVISDTSWKVAPAATAGAAWTTPGFVGADDWPHADGRGVLGARPWGDVLTGQTAAPGATPADQLDLPNDYTAELLYSVPKEEQGSWVSMTVDPQGRLIVSDQYGKLYRVTPPAPKPTARRRAPSTCNRSTCSRSTWTSAWPMACCARSGRCT